VGTVPRPDLSESASHPVSSDVYSDNKTPVVIFTPSTNRGADDNVDDSNQGNSLSIAKQLSNGCTYSKYLCRYRKPRAGSCQRDHPQIADAKRQLDSLVSIYICPSKQATRTAGCFHSLLSRTCLGIPPSALANRGGPCSRNTHTKRGNLSSVHPVPGRPKHGHTKPLTVGNESDCTVLRKGDCYRSKLLQGPSMCLGNTPKSEFGPSRVCCP